VVEGSTGDFGERRNLTLRARRDAVAAWCEVHPRELAALPVGVLEAMVARLGAARELHGQVAELRSSAQRWETLASTDPLTSLANRRVAEERLAHECARASRYGHPLTVLIADVDALKTVNDGHGHRAGDLVLVELGARLQRVVRASDLVARWGGDEFLVICPETDADAASMVADKLVRVGEETVPFDTAELDCGLSVGWATQRGTEIDALRLVRAADEALYRSKWQGRGRATGAG
jgi:diguanylate cyclase (GGDEF)-like protein